MSQIDKIDWSNLFKIKIANPDESFYLHEIVKLLIVMKLLKKYKKDKTYLRIYTEFQVGNTGKKADVYFENLRTKSVLVYEIQKNFNDNYIDKTNEIYMNVDIPYMKFDWCIIDLNKLSKNLDELDKQLNEFIRLVQKEK